ncbi:PRC-barrel domain-containing protein [Croceicoccus gelatinilyticus]|uniref:PRC-barrel domain-containing protein n=1 Tax=Croceicoccus gelatinilyticus TaxID=2835536 RepID=UPI001BCECEFE|nr:PRC-barrel domain-containing protein [Croceicoccus gelatinilyticus]MBS7668139.1 PRC-barrel domain-containing protein [Croceicoccus gelatinilyticus]
MVDTIQDSNQPTGSYSQTERTLFKRDEGHDLIASNRVEGTNVYRPDGTKLGQVHHFMVGKRNGRVEYAVLSFGGFLGLGKELRPVPWDVLDYDTEQNGYVISAEEDVLKDAPYIQEGKTPMWDRAFGAHIYGYWGVPY